MFAFLKREKAKATGFEETLHRLEQERSMAETVVRNSIAVIEHHRAKLIEAREISEAADSAIKALRLQQDMYAVSLIESAERLVGEP